MMKTRSQCCFFWFVIGLISGGTLMAQPGYAYPAPAPPPLPSLDYRPELINGVGKWFIHAPTIAGWHYSLEQLGTDGMTWSPLPEGQYYGNGLPIKYFVTDGPMPSEGGAAPPPPSDALSWQWRSIKFDLLLRKNGLSNSFLLRRAETSYPPALTPVAAWDATLTDPMPSLAAWNANHPMASKTFLFQSWDDPEARIMWNTEFSVTLTEAAPPVETLATTSEEAGELVVFQHVKDQLIGAMISPVEPGPPATAGPRKIIRLRRTGIDTNQNGLYDWWELKYGYPSLTAGISASTDSDGDGLSNREEQRLGTNPRRGDTDQDGSPDGRDPSPADASVYPPIFETQWRSILARYQQRDPAREIQTGPGFDAEGNLSDAQLVFSWSPTTRTPAFNAYQSLTAAYGQLSAPMAWPVFSPASAYKESDAPSQSFLHWSHYVTNYDEPEYSYISSDLRLEQSRVRYHRATASPDPLPVTLLRLKEDERNSLYGFWYPGYAFHIGSLSGMDKLELEIPANELNSPPLELSAPLEEPSPAIGFWNLERQHCYAELQRAPAVLPVNANFDEGIIDAATGFAKPDSSDADLKADRDLPWTSAVVKSGDLITTDLHQGWFGLRPDAFEPAVPEYNEPAGTIYSFYEGASIRIRKIAQTDPDTDAPESGHIRLWITKGDGPTAQSYPVDAYDRNSPVFTPVELVGQVYGPNATLPRPAPDVRYWLEGLTPGKCTLEFKCTRGPHTITHRQTFLVATQKTKSEWLEEVRQQILVQTTGGRDMAHFLPQSGYMPRAAPDSAFGSNSFIYHHPRVRAIYDWYGQLYQQFPDKLDWMGAACQVGGAVYGGLCDMYSPANITGAFRESVGPQLMGGAILIYRDLGWQHRAWISSGLPALKWVAENNAASVNGIAGQSAAELDVWEDFDKAIRDSNWANIKIASTRLVRREQAETIVPMWDNIRNANGGGTTSGFLEAAASIPSFYPKNAADPLGYNFQQVVPGGNVDQYVDRDRFSFGWNGIRTGQATVAAGIATKGVFPVWWGDQVSSYGYFYNAARRMQLVRFSLLDRAEGFAQPGSTIFGR